MFFRLARKKWYIIPGAILIACAYDVLIPLVCIVFSVSIVELLIAAFRSGLFAKANEGQENALQGIDIVKTLDIPPDMSYVSELGEDAIIDLLWYSKCQYGNVDQETYDCLKEIYKNRENSRPG